MFRFVLLFSLLVLSLKADMIMSPDALPKNTREFISSNFKAPISLVQVDDSTYEVYLSDGSEFEFDISGNFKEVKSKFTPISPSILPANIATIITHEYPNAHIVKIERKILYYEIKLSNQLELKIDTNGTVLSREFDD